MNQQQYVMLILILSAVGQRSDAFDQLDDEQLQTAMYMLDQAHTAAVEAQQQRTKESHG